MLQSFVKAINKGFFMIDVVKHQIEVSRKGTKSKPIPLMNKLKIITFSYSTWNLWNNVILRVD